MFVLCRTACITSFSCRIWVLSLLGTYHESHGRQTSAVVFLFPTGTCRSPHDLFLATSAAVLLRNNGRVLLRAETHRIMKPPAKNGSRAIALCSAGARPTLPESPVVPRVQGEPSATLTASSGPSGMALRATLQRFPRGAARSHLSHAGVCYPPKHSTDGFSAPRSEDLESPTLLQRQEKRKSSPVQ